MTATSDEVGNFCHDYIEHPLMWCDEKKRLVERKNAEESLRMWRRRKAEEVARKEKEKQEYYDIFLKHCPWGRPGGGAPNIDIRRKDITAVGLHSTPTVTTAHRLSSLQPCRYNDYFISQKKCHQPLAPYNHQHYHQHHHHHHPQHVPARQIKHTHSVHHLQESGPKGSTLTICEREMPVKHVGKNGETLEITLKEHPSISFRNKGHLDIEVRYKPQPANKGKSMLEKIVVTQGDEKCAQNNNGVADNLAANNNDLKKNLQAKLEKPLSKVPWGKAGPGGKPWRSPKAVGNTFMKSLGWTNKEMLKELDQDNPATPAEKHTFRKKHAGAAAAHKKIQRCCELCTCTCPAMTVMANSPYKTLLKKSPPIKTEKSKLCPRLVRHCAGGLNTSASNDNAQSTTDQNTSAAANAGGGVELVPLLARRRALNRPISLSSTDVTKRTASHDRLTTAADLRYLHDLNVQISQKRRSISVSKQIERDLCQQHFSTFDTFWGRPGHGAPGVVKTKLKLDNLLYGNQDINE